MQPKHIGFFRYSSIVVGLLLIALSIPIATGAKTVEELKAELQDKREALKDAESRIQKFKEDIQIKRTEARTLKDQIGLID